jgi:hypothetical protein
MTYTPADFGLDKNGPQFAWLNERLTLHGFPPVRLMHNLKDRVQAFQLAQGWTGTGADGLVGPKTLLRLSAAPASVPVPSNVVEMSKFKRTLPTGEPGHPTELYPLVDTAGPVPFRAPVDGVHTENTEYARDELREEVPKAWSTNDGKHHRMIGSCRVTEIPGRKTDDYTPGVVFAQIHDVVDDVIILLVDLLGRVILEKGLGPDNGSKKYELFTGYRVGDQLSYVIDAHAGGIDVTVNGHHILIDKTVDGGYFKAGCYLRGNTKNATGAGSVDYDALGTRHAA